MLLYKMNKTLEDYLVDIISIVSLLMLFILFTVPFIHLLSISLSDANRISPGIKLIPVGFTLSSFKASLTTSNILNSIFVSVLRSIIGVISILAVNTMAAYVISKDEMIGVRFLRKFFIITMYVSGGIIPSYFVMKTVGLVGTFWVYIFPLIVTPFYLILIKTYMQNIPKSLEESALIDGASHFLIYRKITLPLSVPVLSAVGLFAVINHWNAMTDTAIYNSMNPQYYTLQYVLYNMLQHGAGSLEIAKDMLGSRDIGVLTLRMAVTIITILPIAIIYPFMQRYFISGLMVGSIKG
jgi:putative aldouronate transport system permease protein